MIAILLLLAATCSAEVGISIGKKAVQRQKQSAYTMGFLDVLWSVVFYALLIVFWRKEFQFSLESLPTFLPRIVLEIILAQITLTAIVRADRSTFNFIRVGTIPLLLFVDAFLGYPISGYHIIGIILIVCALGAIFVSRGIARKGILFCLASMTMAVATISLFKYDITHFNGVEAEQGTMTLVLLLYFVIMARIRARENALAFLFRPRFFLQAFAAGLANVLIAFPYALATASLITAAHRALSVLWAIVSGQVYFHEKHLVLKMALFLLLIAGLGFLAFA